jgi:hypothetical protein
MLHKHGLTEAVTGHTLLGLVMILLLDSKGCLTCSKILRYGSSGSTSHSKECVLRIFLALKGSLAGFEPATLGSSGKHTTAPLR